VGVTKAPLLVWMGDLRPEGAVKTSIATSSTGQPLFIPVVMVLLVLLVSCLLVSCLLVSCLLVSWLTLIFVALCNVTLHTMTSCNRNASP